MLTNGRFMVKWCIKHSLTFSIPIIFNDQNNYGCANKYIILEPDHVIQVEVEAVRQHAASGRKATSVKVISRVHDQCWTGEGENSPDGKADNRV